MIGYIARDKDGDLYLHSEFPKLDKDLESYFSEDFFQLKDNDFPEFRNIVFETGPIKVEINIKRI